MCFALIGDGDDDIFENGAISLDPDELGIRHWHHWKALEKEVTFCILVPTCQAHLKVVIEASTSTGVLF